MCHLAARTIAITAHDRRAVLKESVLHDPKRLVTFSVIGPIHSSAIIILSHLLSAVLLCAIVHTDAVTHIYVFVICRRMVLGHTVFTIIGRRTLPQQQVVANGLLCSNNNNKCPPIFLEEQSNSTIDLAHRMSKMPNLTKLSQCTNIFVVE